MSEKGDAAKMIKFAIDLGYTVEKLKHGGYAVKSGEDTVTRIPSTGNSAPHWIRRVRRDLGC